MLKINTIIGHFIDTKSNQSRVRNIIGFGIMGDNGRLNQHQDTIERGRQNYWCQEKQRTSKDCSEKSKILTELLLLDKNYSMSKLREYADWL